MDITLAWAGKTADLVIIAVMVMVSCASFADAIRRYRSK